MLNFMGKLDYCADTGLFYHSVDNRGSTRKGQVAGTKRPNGYIQVKVCGKVYYAHRLAFYLVHGYWPKEVDHLDRDKTNNRISNLVESDRVLNNHNKNARSGVKGVHKGPRGKFVSQVTVNGVTTHLGTFSCETSAGIAYELARKSKLAEYQGAKRRD